MKKNIYINKRTIPLFLFDSIDSTMNEIKKKKYNNFNEVAVIASQQTQGRGRRNNNWISDKGNYYLSIRLKQKIQKNFHFVTYVISIVLFDIIKKHVLKSTEVFIKWPNDIYLNEKKVCGILIEFLSYGNKLNDIIIGVGVNISNNPKKLKKSSTYLKKYSNLNIETLEFTKSILKGTDYWIKILIENKDIIIKEWMKRSKKVNSKIKFYYKDQLVNGIYKGIADDGSIEVLMENKKNNFFNLDLV